MLLEEKVSQLIQSSKHSYEANLVSSFSNNPRKLYIHLKRLANNRFTPKFLVHPSSQSLTAEPKEKCEIFNDFFHSTFTNSNYRLPPLEYLSSLLHQLSNISITPSDVYEHLSQLDSTKTAGCNNIHPKILKFCAMSLPEPVTNLFNLCLSQSNIPFEWKTHKITPVPKKGDLSNAKNYRPISALCIPSKVLESIIYTKIIDYVRPQLSKNQHGFLKNRSCLSQLLLSYNKISCSLENKQSTNSIFLDFSKAFDSVPHDELLYKLWVMEITGPLWLWFRAYLTNRYHYVSLEGASSRCLPACSFWCASRQCTWPSPLLDLYQ